MEHIDQLIDALSKQQWATSHTLLPRELAQDLYAEAHQLYLSGEVKPAEIGKGVQQHNNQNIRNTQICWFDPAQLTAAQEKFWTVIEQLRETLNQTCFLSLAEFECHYTLYPPGAYYGRHLDQFHSDKRRTISFAYYLNPNWTASDGGSLRLYLDDSDERFVDILPEAGTFAVFQSGALEHEVLPTKRSRYGVVGWMKTRHTGNRVF